MLKYLVLLLVAVISLQASGQNARTRAEALVETTKKKVGKKDLGGTLADLGQSIDAYRFRGICKMSLKSNTGACEDWNKALELGSETAAELITDNCKVKDKK